MTDIQISYTAMIIEPRCHKALNLVLKNFNKNLNFEWQFIIFHGNNNIQFIDEIICQDVFKNRHIIKVNLNVDNLQINDYNLLMYNENIYNHINTEMFLVFQTDTLLSDIYASDIYTYMNYDYVGAPWIFNRQIGNGGLSLRRKSKMIALLRSNEFLLNAVAFQQVNEDVFFSGLYCECLRMNIIINKPTYENAMHFSVETVFCDKSVGIHKAWGYNSSEQLNIIKQHIFDLDELIILNS